MKNMITASLIVFLVMCLAPLITLTQNQTYSTSETTALSNEDRTNVRVLQTVSGKVLNIDINEYLIGVVASEMPASFEEEALKAQVVASYTYLRWIMKNADNTTNTLCDITDDSKKHQGYLSKQEMQQRWGKKYETYYEKLKQSVESVRGEYLEYNNEPIQAAFHGLSAGTTNSSEDIWNTAIPYLVNVEAPGDRLSSDLESEVTVTKDEFFNLLNIKESDINNKSIYTVKEKTKNGFIKNIKIADIDFSAAEIRNIFSLKSLNFTIEESKEKISFKVFGKGHGLGMSQYSADFMARQGESYRNILKHFYPGTEIIKD